MKRGMSGLVFVVFLSISPLATARDLGYQSTRSLRGVPIPRITLQVLRTPRPDFPDPDHDFTGQIFDKIRLDDGQNWITVQFGHFGFGSPPVQHAADVRILSKRVGGTVQILPIGRARRNSLVILRRVRQSNTGVTLEISWLPEGASTRQVLSRHIAIPWAGAERLRVATDVPDRLELWESRWRLDATLEWVQRVGWQPIGDSLLDDEPYDFGCHTFLPEGTSCFTFDIE